MHVPDWAGPGASKGKKLPLQSRREDMAYGWYLPLRWIDQDGWMKGACEQWDRACVVQSVDVSAPFSFQCVVLLAAVQTETAADCIPTRTPI